MSGAPRELRRRSTKPLKTTNSNVAPAASSLFSDDEDNDGRERKIVKDTTKTEKRKSRVPESENEDNASDVDEEDEFRSLKTIVSVSGDIDHEKLLGNLRTRFKNKEKKWTGKAANYAHCNLILQLIVLILQVTALGLQQIPDNQIFDPSTLKILQSVLAAISGIIVSVQMKLRLNRKAEKYKRGAKVYGRLLRQTTYYDMILQSGGKLGHVPEFWRECMEKEDHVPLPKSTSLSS